MLKIKELSRGRNKEVRRDKIFWHCQMMIKVIICQYQVRISQPLSLMNLTKIDSNFQNRYALKKLEIDYKGLEEGLGVLQNLKFLIKLMTV